MNNPITRTDSYKVTHYLQYPPGTQHVYSYYESRGGTPANTIFFGLQYYLKKYLAGQVVTNDHIAEAQDFFDKHFGRDVFNIDGWQRIVDVHGGKLPVVIKAVPEGSLVDVLTPLMTVENTDHELPWLTNYIETILCEIWYPITVATRSYYMKQTILKYLEETGTPADTGFKLHDFGFRGSTSVESASIGGAAHLVNFLGTDTMVALEMLAEYYDCDMAAFSIPACYDGDTDILTSAGWKRFGELDGNEKVAQYREDGCIEFVLPTAFPTYEYKGDMIQFYSKSSTAGIDLLVTPKHRMVRKSTATGNIEIQFADEATFSGKNVWIQSGASCVDGEGMTDYEKLLVAFQADGSYPSRKNAYNGARTGLIPIRFNLKKVRKVERLKNILDAVGCEYMRHVHKNEHSSFWIKLEDKIPKTLDWVNLENVSSKWCADFIDEIALWDGTAKGDNVIYTSTVEENANMVQACAVLAGYRASIQRVVDSRTDHERKPLFQVNISMNTWCRGGQGIKKNVVTYEGRVYCVTVPSGMIVVRRNGYVSISGNSEHSTITSWGRDNEVDAFDNMITQFPDGIVACVSDSFDIYRACDLLWGTLLKDAVMDRDGTLIVRPDSGMPEKVVPRCLEILGNRFGYTTNEKGYKVLDPHVRMIQGDGVSHDGIANILQVMKNRGWSADNIAFGSGGALLQKMNRDTYNFAFKCSEVTIDGERRPVYKNPITQHSKASKSGRFTGLTEVFRDGEVVTTYTLDEIRTRLDSVTQLPGASDD